MTWSGDGASAHWADQARPVDFFDIKGAVEVLCEALGVAPLEFGEAAVPYLVRGRAAEVRSDGRQIGLAGLLDPGVAAARGFAAGEDIYVAEIDVDAAAAIAGSPELRAKSLPKFPAIVRDISILVAEALPAAAVRGTIRAAAPATLESLAEFDRYQGKGVPEGRVSLSLRLTFRSPERTLTDEEVEAAMDAIVRALHETHGAERR
jgi:phenylalanyl-tRNA synthetase beta chain